MREIATHKVNGLNESLKIEVIDEPGAGGANHRYDVTGFNTEANPAAIAPDGYKSSFGRLIILFQNGPVREAFPNGPNGISHEVLLAIVRDRLESFQKGPFACVENEKAFALIDMALQALHSRTKARIERGVEGTSVR